MLHFYFESTNDKVLKFNIVYFPNFEISVSVWLVAPFNKDRTSQFCKFDKGQGLLLEEIRYLLQRILKLHGNSNNRLLLSLS